MKPLVKIMIVDDEMLVRQGIKHLLDWEQEGYQIAGEASNGLEALNLIDKVNPHVILTDIVMPVMGGEQLVKAVKEKYPRIEIIVLSSFGEFDYVRSTFQSGVADYILKPKLEADYLLSILKKTTVKMTAVPASGSDANPDESQLLKVMEKLMAGYESALEPELIQSRFPYEQYLFFGADLKNRQDSSEKSDLGNEIERGLQKLEPVVAEFAHMRLKFVNETVLFLLNMNPEKSNELVMELRHLISSMELFTSGTHFMISQSFTDFTRLGEIYKDNYLKLLRYGFFLQNRSLIEHDHLPSLPDKQLEFEMSVCVDQLKRKQYLQAFTGFLEYIHLRSMDYRTDIFEFKSYLGNFIFNVTTTLGKMKVETESLEKAKYDYFRKIDEARSASEAIAIVEAFIHETERTIGETNTLVNPNMARLLEYIQKHYADPITLTEVAKQFHFNASYLSSYFAAYNGEGFSEYLNKIRIKKAMELLMTTELTISEISANVGYSDQSYFTKVFKKQAGISPSQYRRQDMREIRES